MRTSQVFSSQVFRYDALQDDWIEAEPLLFPRLAYVASVQVFFTQLFYGSVAICDDYLIMIGCSWKKIEQFRFISIQNMPKVPQSVCQLLGRSSQNVTTSGEVRLCKS